MSQKIVLVGNCQMNSIADLFRRFVAPQTGDTIAVVPSYESLSVADRQLLETANIVGEQVLSGTAKVDLSEMGLRATQVRIPLVGVGFLWPYAGQPHPHNITYPFYPSGVYDPELGDSFLNTLVRKGVGAEDAPRIYSDLDIHQKRPLDRFYELSIGAQRSRDEATGFAIADIIEQHFRHELIAFTPHHPGTRLVVALTTQFFERAGVPSEHIERMQRNTRVSPVPQHQAPVHPSVQAFFDVRWVDRDTLYRSIMGDWISFETHVRRYMVNDHDPEFLEAMALAGSQREVGIAKLRAALTRYPDSYAAHGECGILLHHSGDMDNALYHLQRAVELDPSHAKAHFALSHVFSQFGRPAEALAHAVRAAEIDPGDVHFQARAGQLNLEAGRVVDAIPYVEQAMAMKAKSSFAHFELADTLNRLGRREEALEHIQRAIELHGGRSQDWHLQATILSDIGQNEEALTSVETALSLSPEDQHCLGMKATILYRLGRFTEARDAALRALHHAPDNPHLFALLSSLALEEGRAEEAIAYARKSVRCAPGEMAFQHHLDGVLRHFRGDGELVATATPVLDAPFRHAEHAH